MLHIILGQEGSGKTKKLIDAIHSAAEKESGSIVCIEKGNTMRYDIDHSVRLVDASEYPVQSYVFLKGFICGLHAGNFDISHIFIDNLNKVAKCTDAAETEDFLDWCNDVSVQHGVSFTVTMIGDAENAPAYIAKYL